MPSRGSSVSVFGTAFGRALHIIAVEPNERYTTLMSGIYQAALYCFYIAFALVFQEVYHFSPYQVGLSFLPLLVGSLLGSLVYYILDELLYRPHAAEAKRTNGVMIPEKRLYAGIFGGILMPISLFSYVFCSSSSRKRTGLL